MEGLLLGATAESAPAPEEENEFEHELGAAKRKADEERPPKQPSNEDMWQALVAVLVKGEVEAPRRAATEPGLGTGTEPAAAPKAEAGAGQGAVPATTSTTTIEAEKPTAVDGAESLGATPKPPVELREATRAQPLAPAFDSEAAKAPTPLEQAILIHGESAQPAVQPAERQEKHEEPAPAVVASPSVEVREAFAIPGTPSPTVAATGRAEAPAPMVPPEPATERGHIGTALAEVVIGEGQDQLALRISTAGAHVRVEASAASSGLALALQQGAGELRTALARHGLELSEISRGDMDPNPSDVKRVARKPWKTVA